MTLGSRVSFPRLGLGPSYDRPSAPFTKKAEFRERAVLLDRCFPVEVFSFSRSNCIEFVQGDSIYINKMTACFFTLLKKTKDPESGKKKYWIISFIYKGNSYLRYCTAESQ